MKTLLSYALPYLGVLIGILVFAVLFREKVCSFRRKRWQEKKSRCLSLIHQGQALSPNELLSLTIELKKTFSLSLIESVLEDSLSISDPDKNRNQIKLSEIYNRLGLIQKHLETLKKAKGWSERANAAEKLGKIGHVSALPTLITTLQNPHEDREVKNAIIRALGRMKDERAIPILIESLKFPDVMAGQILADTLIPFGESALDPIIQTLSSSDQELQRFWAARILGNLKERRGIQPLIFSLADHTVKVRTEAAHALGNIGASEGISPLCRMLLEDPDPQVREAAAESLGLIADESSVTVLKAGLADLNYSTRLRSMEALEKMGKNAIPFFLDALTDSSEARVQAASALERMGVVAQKIEELDGPQERKSFDCLRLIAKTGVVEALIRSLNHPRFRVRVALCRILAEATHPRTFEGLIHVVEKDKEWAVRLEALSALVKLGDFRSLPLFIKIIQNHDEEEMIRLHLLTLFINAPRSLLEQLWKSVLQLLNDVNLEMRKRAVQILSRLPLSELTPALLESLTDPAWEVRREAALALGKHEQESTDVKKTIIAKLIHTLSDASSQVRIAAVKSLGSLKDPQAIHPLALSFEWADEQSRNEISAALISIPTHNFFELTDELMGLAHPKSRAGVVWTLGLIGDEKIIPFITTFLKDPESIVRSASAGALGKFGLKKMVPVLVEALNDPDERVRAALVNALRQSHEASVIEKLLPMFQSEPDEFVRQRIALTVGSLNICDTPQNQKVSEVIFSLTQMIKQWVENTRNEKSRMAGFIALVLLHDDSIFQKILIDIQTPSLNSLMQELLKELFPEVQNRFFSFLSLDPKLFWNHNSPKMAKHYSALLKSNRDASQRVRAIEALKFLNERSSLPEIEASFTKDPNPQVRAAALETFGSWLESTERLEKIRAAFFDSSEEVHACALSLIHQLKPQDLREVREKLIPLLDINQESIRIPISKLLSHLYYQDWHSLVDQLIGTEKKTRIVGLLETLSTIQDPQLSALFIQFMRHQDPEIRGATATAVANGTNFLSKEEWKSAFDDPQELIRLAAIRGLGKQMDDEVIQFFIDRAEDPSSKVRKEISLFLGKQKSSTLDRQISSLRHLSQNPETEVQIMSFISLFRLGEKNLTPKIISLISQQEKKEMEKLNRDLEKENFFEELITTLQRDHEVVRRKEAMEILATLNFCRYLDELTRCLKDPASEVRIKAMEILAKNEGEHLRKPTALLIQDPGEKGSTAAEKIKPGTIQEES